MAGALVILLVAADTVESDVGTTPGVPRNSMLSAWSSRQECLVRLKAQNMPACLELKHVTSSPLGALNVTTSSVDATCRPTGFKLEPIKAMGLMH